MTKEQKAICHKIADYYGTEHQAVKAIEEMAKQLGNDAYPKKQRFEKLKF